MSGLQQNSNQITFIFIEFTSQQGTFISIINDPVKKNDDGLYMQHQRLQT